MSDLICTTVMCSQAKASVDQMQQTFDNLSSDPSNGEMITRNYGPTVASIKSSFDSNYSVFSEWIPFNPTCCTLQDIGKQADTLTNQMLQSVGASGTGTGPSSQPLPLDFNTALIAAAAIAVAVIVFKIK